VGGAGGGGSSGMMDNSLWGLSSLGAIPDLLDCHRSVDHHQQQQQNISSKLLSCDTVLAFVFFD